MLQILNELVVKPRLSPSHPRKERRRKLKTLKVKSPLCLSTSSTISKGSCGKLKGFTNTGKNMGDVITNASLTPSQEHLHITIPFSIKIERLRKLCSNYAYILLSRAIAEIIHFYMLRRVNIDLSLLGVGLRKSHKEIAWTDTIRCRWSVRVWQVCVYYTAESLLKIIQFNVLSSLKIDLCLCVVSGITIVN